MNNTRFCTNSSCSFRHIPHTHIGESEDHATINDPVLEIGWPQRTHWTPPAPLAPYPPNLFQYGILNTHSGLQLPFKIDCDALTDSDLAALARIIAHKFLFRRVVGVPRGGRRLAAALAPYRVAGYPTLIVDDVLTTGKSMQEARLKVRGPSNGVVIVARGECPDWVWPILRLDDWTQARGTGLG